MLNKNQFVKQFVVILIIFSFFLLPLSVLAANFSGDYKWAWGENIGWLNFQPTDEGVTVANDGLTGYLWAENVGWIKLDYDGTPGATNTTSTNWGVTNDGSGNLGGYAWGENIGWVNFNPTDSQVTIDGNGDFSGYAWAENIGWIKFDHTQTSYTLQTTWSSSVNTAPTITSVSDYSDPVEVGTDVTFSVDWNDADAEGIKMLICKSDAITAATPSCDGGEWCSNKNDYDSTDPITCSYTTQSGDVNGSKNYYAFVCDDDDECSASDSSTFTVVVAGPSVRIKGGFKVKGGLKIKF